MVIKHTLPGTVVVPSCYSISFHQLYLRAVWYYVLREHPKIDYLIHLCQTSKNKKSTGNMKYRN